MTSIVFERRPHVYLPEIAAYKTYLARRYPSIKVFESSALDHYDPMAFDCVWRFPGLDRLGAGRHVVHEYNSLSTGKLPRLKNNIKKWVNARPLARVFLNDQVQQGFSFHDSCPGFCRDMGVDPQFFVAPSVRPDFDFVYSGRLDRGPVVMRFFDKFFKELPNSRLLVIGEVPALFKDRYAVSSNITFTGRVAYHDMPGLLTRARFGLNIMPDCYPYNLQTATKVLEYCAAGLRIVSTDYAWVRKFERERKGKFFFLNSGFENLSPAALETFEFQTPKVDDLLWDTLIEQSKMFDFILGRIEDGDGRKNF